MGRLLLNERIWINRFGRPVLLVSLPVLVLALALPAASASTNVTGWTAFVANFGSGSLSAFSTATNAVSSTASIPISNPEPNAIVISPNGATAYVADSNTSSISVIATATNTVTSEITETSSPGNPQDPSALALSPDGSVLYVANSGNSGIQNVEAISTSTGNYLNDVVISGGQSLDGIAVTPNGNTAYVADGGTGEVTPITLSTMTTGTLITLPQDSGAPASPIGLAITPDGSKLFVTDQDGSDTYAISTALNTIIATIPVGNGPGVVTISPNGLAAFVGDLNDNLVTPINIAANTAGTAISLPAGSTGVADTFGLAVTPDDSTLYVADGENNQIDPITISTGVVGTPIPVGSIPDWIAITPDQAPVASFTDSTVTVGQSTAFDASASTVPVGSIASYVWNFGDGSPTTIATVPTVSHIYQTSGNFTATVTETSSAGTSTTQVFNGQMAVRNGGPGAVATQSVTVNAAPIPPPKTETVCSIKTKKVTLRTVKIKHGKRVVVITHKTERVYKKITIKKVKKIHGKRVVVITHKTEPVKVCKTVTV